MKRLLVLAAGAVLLAAVSADATTWKVGRGLVDCDGTCNFHDTSPGSPGPGFGIERALGNEAVVSGDTLLVWPGAYTARLLMKSGVVLISKDGPEVTTLCGQAGSDVAVRFVDTSDATIVEGFTIRWRSLGSGFGGGVAALNASGVVRNNIFVDCQADVGAAIFQSFSNVRIENNFFVNNISVFGGGAIALTSSHAEIVNNTFHSNEAPFGFDGSVLFAIDSDYLFDRNVVSGSTGAPAIVCAGSNDPIVTCNVFFDNLFGPSGGNCVDSAGTGGNFFGDPLICDPDPITPGFCGPSNDPPFLTDFDFGVCIDSPTLTGPCGVIGYSSPTGNCAACFPTPVATLESSTWGWLKASYRR